MHSNLFTKAIAQNDMVALQSVPKSDLHNHGMLGYRREVLETQFGYPLAPAPVKFAQFSDFDTYLVTTFGPLLKRKDFLELALQSAFQQAKADGVMVLQMSIDTRFHYFFSAKEIVETVGRLHKEHASDVKFVPQLGMDRTLNIAQLMRQAEELLDTGFFKSIDLYGEELHDRVDVFIPLYRRAKQMGLVLAAHVGEYGPAESVRRVAEKLELQQIQHGISAAQSPEVMQWLANNNLVLNICPSSNVALCRVESIAKHPIRALFDAGVRVTVNTDDLFVFNQSVSNEFSNLYSAGVFTAEELNRIRLYGLGAFE
ncbi:MAG: adenosine deaminase [Bacteroidota bacterium]